MKTALITGASRGIGREVSIKLAKSGFNVAINYNKSEEEAKLLRQELEDMGVRSKIFCADVSKNDQVQNMTMEAIREFGKIDVLVNNAGVALPQGLFTDFSEEETRRIFDTNVYGTMNCARAIIPHFVSLKSGKIINISSIWGIAGGSCEVIYSASKGAIVAFTKALAKELAPSGICVNCVCPGLIDTDMNKHLSLEEKQVFTQEIPLGRIGTGADVAGAVDFLASDSADYITGQTIVVDGGFI